MARYVITVILTVLLILLSIAGLLACAFGVLQDLDQVAAVQTACFIGLIVSFYFLSVSDTQSEQGGGAGVPKSGLH